MEYSTILCIVGAIAIIIALYYFLKREKQPENSTQMPLSTENIPTKGNKEYYGGPIKNVRKIPITTGYDICDFQYAWCLGSRPYAYSDTCERKQYACRSEMYYSNAQRF